MDLTFNFFFSFQKSVFHKNLHPLRDSGPEKKKTKIKINNASNNQCGNWINSNNSNSYNRYCKRTHQPQQQRTKNETTYEIWFTSAPKQLHRRKLLGIGVEKQFPVKWFAFVCSSIWQLKGLPEAACHQILSGLWIITRVQHDDWSYQKTLTIFRKWLCLLLPLPLLRSLLLLLLLCFVRAPRMESK